MIHLTRIRPICRCTVDRSNFSLSGKPVGENSGSPLPLWLFKELSERFALSLPLQQNNATGIPHTILVKTGHRADLGVDFSAVGPGAWQFQQYSGSEKWVTIALRNTVPDKLFHRTI